MRRDPLWFVNEFQGAVIFVAAVLVIGLACWLFESDYSKAAREAKAAYRTAEESRLRLLQAGEARLAELGLEEFSSSEQFTEEMDLLYQQYELDLKKADALDLRRRSLTP